LTKELAVLLQGSHALLEDFESLIDIGSSITTEDALACQKAGEFGHSWPYS
jgi:hypothetical protein